LVKINLSLLQSFKIINQIVFLVAIELWNENQILVN